MTMEDLVDVLRLENAGFEDGWTEARYVQEILNTKYGLPLVLHASGKLIGHTVAWQLQEKLYIASMTIDRLQRRKGWGEYLLHRVICYAGPARYVELHVSSNNVAAISLYCKAGFTEFAIKPSYYSNKSDALEMRLYLT